MSLIEDYLPNVQFTGNMSSDTQPVIAKTVYDRLLIVWRVPIGFETAGTPAGLYYHYVGHRYNQSTFDWKNSGDDPIKISNTSSATYNPTLAVDWSGYSDPFHLAWQYGLGNVQYYQLSQTSGRSTITPQYFETISTGSGFASNRNPSIAIIQHQPVVSWYSSNTSLGGHIDQEDPPSVVKKIVSRRKIGSSWSNFFQNGNDVYTHYLASSRDNNVLLIWNEYVNGNYISKVSQNILTVPSSFNSIGSKVVSANHSSVFDGIYAFGLNSQNSRPYDFAITDLDITNPSKITVNSVISEGRSGVVFEDTTQYFFALGDTVLDGTDIEFMEVPETLAVNTISLLNEYLSTEPFTLSDGSSLTYSVYYGITDSAGTAESLSENEFINFKIELVDAISDEVIGIYDDVTFTIDDFEYYENIQYEIDAEGAGEREVRLRLIVDDNLNGGYSYSTIKADNSVFAKTSLPMKIDFMGSLEVKEYNLAQNYPNPFNPSTIIKYQIPQAGIVTLKVYDILGREVTTLVNKHQNIGRYEVEFNASKLSSGIYIYQLNANNYSQSKKMILMK